MLPLVGEEKLKALPMPQGLCLAAPSNGGERETYADD
jgi:hypothetical protein